MSLTDNDLKILMQSWVESVDNEQELSKIALSFRTAELFTAFLTQIIQPLSQKHWDDVHDKYLNLYRLEKMTELETLSKQKIEVAQKMKEREKEIKTLQTKLNTPSSSTSMESLAKQANDLKSLLEQYGIEKEETQSIQNILKQERKAADELKDARSNYKTAYQTELQEEKIKFNALLIKTKQELYEKCYGFFLDALEEKAELYKPMIVHLRLFLQEEQQYLKNYCQRRALFKNSTSIIANTLEDQQDTLEKNKENIQHYEREQTRLNNLITEYNIKLKSSLSRQLKYKILAIISGLPLFVVPIIALTISLDLFLLSILILPILFLIATVCTGLSLGARDEATSQRNTIQEATQSAQNVLMLSRNLHKIIKILTKIFPIYKTN